MKNFTNFTFTEIKTLIANDDAVLAEIGMALLKANMPLLTEAVETGVEWTPGLEAQMGKAETKSKAKDKAKAKAKAKAKKAPIGESKAKKKAKKDGISISQLIQDSFGSSKREFSIEEISEKTGLTLKETRDSCWKQTYQGTTLTSSESCHYRLNR